MIGYLLLAIALVEFIVGLYLIFRYERSQSTMYYGFFAISVAIYVAANGFGFTRAFDNEFIFEQLAWIGGLSTAPFILAFSYSFPSPKKTVLELLPWVIWPLIIIVVGILFSDAILDETYIYSFAEGYSTPDGQLFWFALAIFFVYWSWAIKNVLQTRKMSSGFYRNFLSILLVGLLTSLLISIVFDVYLPLVTVTAFGFIGAFFSSVWLLVTSYLILRK